jgi:hypothetical protein
MRRPFRLSSFANVFTAVLLSAEARTAAATEPARAATCADAAERGQIAANQSAFMTARAAFTVCADAACPAVVRADCAAWLGDVGAQLSKLTVRSVSADQTRLDHASVTVDGEPRLPFAAVELDPGEHDVEVSAPGFLTWRESVTLAHAEVRALDAILSAATPPREAGFSASEAPRRQRAAPSSSLPYWLLAGGAVTLGAGATLGLLGKARVAELRGSCAPSCAVSDVDGAHTELIVADSLLLLGAATVVTGGVFWWTHREHRFDSAPRVAVVPRKEGAVLAITGSYQ